jgi:hypothetical protein
VSAKAWTTTGDPCWTPGEPRATLDVR